MNMNIFRVVLLPILSFLPTFLTAAVPPAIYYNPWSTNRPPLPVMGDNNLSVSNRPSGQFWQLFGTNPSTVATLQDITNSTSSMLGPTNGTTPTAVTNIVQSMIVGSNLTDTSTSTNIAVYVVGQASNALSTSISTALGDDEVAMAYFPDSQMIVTYVQGVSNWLSDAATFVNTNWDRWGLVCAIHTGDLVDNGSSSFDYMTALTNLSSLTNRPFLIGSGNHDFITCTTNTRTHPDGYNTNFGPQVWTNRAWWDGGVFSPTNADDSWFSVTNKGHKFLFMTLEFAPRREVMVWATNIMATHSDHYVMMNEHAFVDSGTGEMISSNRLYLQDASTGLSPVEMWQYLSPITNLFAIFSGHKFTPGVGRGVLWNNAGKPVYLVQMDPQGSGAYSGRGTTNYQVRIYRFSPIMKRLTAMTYCTSGTNWLRDSENEFMLQAGTDPQNSISVMRIPDYNSLKIGGDGIPIYNVWTVGKRFDDSTFRMAYGSNDISTGDTEFLRAYSTESYNLSNHIQGGVAFPAGIFRGVAIGTNSFAAGDDSALYIMNGTRGSHIVLQGGPGGTNAAATYGIGMDSNPIPSLIIGAHSMGSPALTTNQYLLKGNWNISNLASATIRSMSTTPADYTNQNILDLKQRANQVGNLLTGSSDGGTNGNLFYFDYLGNLHGPGATITTLNDQTNYVGILVITTNLEDSQGNIFLLSTNPGPNTLATYSAITNIAGSGTGGSTNMAAANITNLFAGTIIAGTIIVTNTGTNFLSNTVVLVSGNYIGNGSGLTNLPVRDVVTNAYSLLYSTNPSVLTKQLSNGANVTITDNGTHLIIAASLGGGAASLADVTNVVQSYVGVNATNVTVAALNALTNNANSRQIGSAALTNAVASGIVTNGTLLSASNALLPLIGGTVTGAVFSTAASASNGPANNEFPTAHWVRSLFNSGEILYASTNILTAATNNNEARTVFQFTNQIPPTSTRTYTTVNLNDYIGSVCWNTPFTFLQGPVSVNMYLERINGTGTPTVSVHPEIYYSYDKTNWYGDWSGNEQAVSTGTNLYQWVISFPTITSTNSTGFYLERRLKVGAVGGSTHPDVVFHIGTNYLTGSNDASHIAFSGPSSAMGNAFLANNQTFTGLNTFNIVPQFGNTNFALITDVNNSSNRPVESLGFIKVTNNASIGGNISAANEYLSGTLYATTGVHVGTAIRMNEPMMNAFDVGIWVTNGPNYMAGLALDLGGGPHVVVHGPLMIDGVDKTAPYFATGIGRGWSCIWNSNDVATYLTENVSDVVTSYRLGPPQTSFSTINIGTMTLTNPLGTASGGTGTNAPATTPGQVLTANGSFWVPSNSPPGAWSGSNAATPLSIVGAGVGAVTVTSNSGVYTLRGMTVSTNGVAVGQTTNLDFISGSNVVLTVTNTSGQLSVGVNAASTGVSGLPSIASKDVGAQLMVNPLLGSYWHSPSKNIRIQESFNATSVGAPLTSSKLVGANLSVGNNPGNAPRDTRNGFCIMFQFATNFSASAPPSMSIVNSGTTYVLTTNFYFETEMCFQQNLTNSLFRCGVSDSTAVSNDAHGIFWEFNANPASGVTNFVARSIGGSSTNCFTNTFPIAINTWYTLGFYGNTNSVIFTTNSVPCVTNSMSGTLAGGYALYLVEKLSTAQTNTVSTENDVYLNYLDFFEY